MITHFTLTLCVAVLLQCVLAQMLPERINTQTMVEFSLTLPTQVIGANCFAVIEAFGNRSPCLNVRFPATALKKKCKKFFFFPLRFVG